MPYEVDPTDGGNVSESLKEWFRGNVQTLFLDARHADATRLIYRPSLYQCGSPLRLPQLGL